MEKCNIKEFLTKHYFQRYFTRGKQDLSAKNIPNDSNATPPLPPPPQKKFYKANVLCSQRTNC